MSILETIQSGKESKPPRLMIYGQEGIGKSTFAAAAPNPIFIQTEDGLGEINCKKFPLAKTYDEVLADSRSKHALLVCLEPMRLLKPAARITEWIARIK